MQSIAVAGLVLFVSASACRGTERSVAVDASPTPQSLTNSAYPLAVDPARVGTYAALAKAGAGYFYDDVLEYRVWVHHAEGGDDTFMAFSTYEQAQQYSQVTAGAEDPLVLVRQREWVNQPSPDEYTHERGERIAEWRVEWLAGHRREPGSIERFLAERRRRGPTKS